MKKSIAVAFAAVFFIGAVILVISSKPVVLSAGNLTPVLSPSESPSQSQSPAVPKEFARGVINNNVYTSDYAGLTFVAPDGWAYATDEELAAMMGVSVDVYKNAGVNLSEEVLKEQAISDMMARDPATGASVLVAYEKLKGRIGGAEITEDKYIEKAIAAREKAKVMSYEYGEITKQNIGSNTFTLLPASLPDLNLMQYNYVRRIDNYMVNIFVTVPIDGDINVIMANFI